MSVDPRWKQVFGVYAQTTSHFFKVWTLSQRDARAFQCHDNARRDATQRKRYVHDVDDGDYYGVALTMCDFVRGQFRDHGGSTTLILLREAVELLHVLACIDLALWREVFIETFCLKNAWSRHVVPVWAFMPYDVVARSVEAANKDVMEFFALLERVPRSAIYATARTLMWTILGIDTDPRLQRRVPSHMDMT